MIALNRFEADAVKKKLENYRNLKAMAAELDQKIIRMGNRYRDIAGASAIRYDREPGSGSGEPKESIYHEIFSEQQADEKRAARYRKEAEQIKKFISLIEDDTGRHVIEQAYLQGKRYKTIAEEMQYSHSWIRALIHRCLEKVPASLAEACGLL